MLQATAYKTGWGFNGFLMFFEVCSNFRVSAVLGTAFTFQIIYMGYDVCRFVGDVDEELVCPICSAVLEAGLPI